MHKLAEELNSTLGGISNMLSDAGKKMYYPYGGILGQGAEAAKCRINATVGMAFEEDSSPLTMECFEKQTTLPPKAFLYAGSFGLAPLRARWSEMQREKNPSMLNVPSSAPVVTNALTHGLSVCAELFAGPGDTVVAPDLYWDNYSLIFEETRGAKIKTFPMFDAERRFNAAEMEKLLSSGNSKKILILNFPNNPTGYTATMEDAKAIVAALERVAQSGVPIVAICDDAYFGLVYEDGIHGESLFGELCGVSPNLLAVKLDGTTKEDYVWGLRVGFVTFGFKDATQAQLKALEAKAAGVVRATISNASSIGQHMALTAFSDPGYKKQKQEKYETLRSRYCKIKTILKDHPEYSDSFEAMPFNSGYFMCIRPKGIPAELVRKQLIEKYSTGVIVLSGLIRLAFSTVPTCFLDELFGNVHKAICDLRA